MSSTATSSEKVKGGRGQNKRDWTTNEDNTLMECLMELHQNTNWRGDSGFKNGYLNILETMLEVKLPNSGLRASPHIESKVKTLKGKYGALDDALSQSGFGEKEAVKKEGKSLQSNILRGKFAPTSHDDARGFRFKVIEHWDDIVDLCGKTRATGGRAETGADAIEVITPPTNEVEHVELDGDTQGFRRYPCY
ncbi:hypothetical protein L3X38_036444 [Prunus dulcis]|uniref:Myb/SANT-like domain-containing protein n=1 Tax=Prunus dulcis TaxID=3755 RepID=A0AAD4V371_PRUDU|nr:hypothetical protein L3X38_036444 [Prunus dulcis]